MCKSMKSCGCMGAKVLWALVIVGAVNWGLVGAFDLDLVALVFGSIAWLQDLVYILVGVAGLALLFGGCRCKSCKTSACCAGDTKDMKDDCCGGGCCSAKETK